MGHLRPGPSPSFGPGSQRGLLQGHFPVGQLCHAFCLSHHSWTPLDSAITVATLVQKLLKLIVGTVTCVMWNEELLWNTQRTCS
jgi:hypothetical protein